MSDMLVAAGPLFWFASRAFGLVAYTALTLEVLLGLGASTGYLDRTIGRARVHELHRWLSAIVLATLGMHALVLLGDQTVKLSFVDLLVPFRGPYRPLAVGLGVLAGYALLTLHVSHMLRKLIGPRAWRRLHYISFGTFVLATLHGILAGSDASKLGLKALYVGAALLVSGLTFLRLFQLVVGRRGSAAAQ
jgi:sulfoxide reductase heme-binding subunit YedZ